MHDPKSMDPNLIGVAPPEHSRRQYGRGRRRAAPSEIKTGQGAKIRAAVRLKYGSQEKAALAWGCSQNYVSRLERELTTPEPWMMEDLELQC